MTGRRILIVKPSSLGDILHALPCLQALRRQEPGAWIAWLVNREYAELLEGHPCLNEVIVFDRQRWGALRHLGRTAGELPRFVRALRRRRFDLAVDLQGLLRSALLAWVSGAPERVGLASAREGAPWLYTRRVEVPGGLHAVERNLRVAQALGSEIVGVTGSLEPTEAARDQVRSLLGAAGWTGEPIIVLHPIARRQAKQWPLERFAALGRQIAARPGIGLVLTGSRADAPRVEALARAMDGRVVNLAGLTTLPELAALFRQARLVIGNDSGPLHLAAAVGTPVVALFGCPDPARVGPYGAGHTVVRKPIRNPCSEFQRYCARRPCLNGIEVEEVWAAVGQHLAEAGG